MESESNENERVKRTRSKRKGTRQERIQPTKKFTNEDENGSASHDSPQRRPPTGSRKRSRADSANEIVVQEIPAGNDVGYEGDIEVLHPDEYEDPGSTDTEYSEQYDSTEASPCKESLEDLLHNLRFDRLPSQSIDVFPNTPLEEEWSPTSVRKRSRSIESEKDLDHSSTTSHEQSAKRTRRRIDSMLDNQDEEAKFSSMPSPVSARPRANCLVRPAPSARARTFDGDAMEIDQTGSHHTRCVSR